MVWGDNLLQDSQRKPLNSLKRGGSMEKIIGFCGITCSECPTYLATQKDDDSLRKKTADEWSKMFNAKLSPEDINCDGCITDERVFEHCNVCEIRLCGKGKGIRNCGYCEDYVCEKLNKFFGMVPEAKEVLDKVRKGS